MKQRQENISALIKDKKFVTISELSRQLHYSESTIRRDLVELEKLRIIKRVPGGAIHVRNELIENPTEIKSRVNSLAKSQIADIALDFIEDYSTIFLDSSSTCQYLARLLKSKKQLTIFTTNLSTADILDKQMCHHNIYMIGGKLSNGKVGGPLSEHFIRSFFVNQAFISCRGIGSDGFISELLEEEAMIKRLIRHQAREMILLADSSKFESSFSFRGLTLKEIDYLVTESNISSNMSKLFEASNLEVYQYNND